LALLRKTTCNVRHPMSLRHPVMGVCACVRRVLARVYMCVCAQSPRKCGYACVCVWVLGILTCECMYVCVCAHRVLSRVRMCVCACVVTVLPHPEGTARSSFCFLRVGAKESPQATIFSYLQPCLHNNLQLSSSHLPPKPHPIPMAHTNVAILRVESNIICLYRRCSTLQHVATRCNTLQHTYDVVFLRVEYHITCLYRLCDTLQHAATHLQRGVS